MEKNQGRELPQTRFRALGIDYGLARLGLAISDERKIIASPLGVLKAEKKSELTVQKLKEEFKRWKTSLGYEIDEVIIGMPLKMNGKQGLLADEVKHFIDLLSKEFSFPILIWDERLTTVQAERALKESSVNRKKRSQVIDSVTAVIILQSYLDRKGNSLIKQFSCQE